MDPLTHALVGGVAAKSVNAPKRRFWVMMLLGILPDIDVLANGLGGWAAMFQHRGITHSFVGLIIQPIFFAALFSKWDAGPFRQRALHYSLPIGLHLLCDYLTSFGVPLLLPFYGKEFSADLIHSLTLVPILFMVLGLYWMEKKQTIGWKKAQPLWIAWGFYLAIIISGKGYAGRLAQVNGLSLTTLPSTVNPLSWRAVGSDPDGKVYRYYSIDLLDQNNVKQFAISASSEEGPVQASLAAPLVKEFLENNRWPVSRVLPQKDGVRVEWGTLLFSTRGLVRGKVAVDLSADGEILNQEKIFLFWNPSVH